MYSLELCTTIWSEKISSIQENETKNYLGVNFEYETVFNISNIKINFDALAKTPNQKL